LQNNPQHIKDLIWGLKKTGASHGEGPTMPVLGWLDSSGYQRHGRPGDSDINEDTGVREKLIKYLANLLPEQGTKPSLSPKNGDR
jgi:hypothetical protein